MSRTAVSAALDPPAPRLDGEAEAAVVAVGLSALRREPDQKAELLSQGLFGEPLDVLDRTADGRWLRVAGPDGYPGWTRSWSLATGTREAVAEWGRLATRFVRQPLLWTGGEAGLLPLGARLADDPLRPGGVRGPSGAMALRASEIRKLRPLASPPAKRRAVLKAAELLLGAPYLWGGRSAAGIDCSGLVQIAYGLCGVTLPRDARDQCAALGGARGLRPYRPGARGGTPRPADLLFFGPEGPGGDVTHVALSTGGPGLLHAYGSVGPGSLDPAAGDYESELPPLVLGWAPAALAGLAQAGPATEAASRTPRTA